MCLLTVGTECIHNAAVEGKGNADGVEGDRLFDHECARLVRRRDDKRGRRGGADDELLKGRWRRHGPSRLRHCRGLGSVLGAVLLL